MKENCFILSWNESIAVNLIGILLAFINFLFVLMEGALHL